jgi:hypothetical protein
MRSATHARMTTLAYNRRVREYHPSRDLRFSSQTLLPLIVLRRIIAGSSNIVWRYLSSSGGRHFGCCSSTPKQELLISRDFLVLCGCSIQYFQAERLSRFPTQYFLEVSMAKFVLTL